jgi:lipopolysaccharide cholinephosphotransferase
MPVRIIIFGAGLGGQRAIVHYRQDPGVEILAVADNDRSRHGQELLGVRIIGAEAAATMPCDRIVIASVYHPAIRRQLVEGLRVPPARIDLVPMLVMKGGVDLGDETRRGLARELLLAATRHLTDAGVPHIVDHGTLLGIHRDGDLLPWDNDVDMAIHADQLAPARIALTAFAARFRASACPQVPWRCRIVEGEIDFGGRSTRLPRIFKVEPAEDHELCRNLQLDVIIKHPGAGQVHWLVGMITLHAAESTLTELAHLAYRGEMLPHPRDLDGYLTTLYNDWRTPRKTWTHAQYANITGPV